MCHRPRDKINDMGAPTYWRLARNEWYKIVAITVSDNQWQSVTDRESQWQSVAVSDWNLFVDLIKKLYANDISIILVKKGYKHKWLQKVLWKQLRWASINYLHCLPKVFWQRLLTGAKLPLIQAVWEGKGRANLLVRWGHFLLGP